MIDECDDDVCGMGLLHRLRPVLVSMVILCFGEYGNSPRAETALVCLLLLVLFVGNPPPFLSALNSTNGPFLAQ